MTLLPEVIQIGNIIILNLSKITLTNLNLILINYIRSNIVNLNINIYLSNNCRVSKKHKTNLTRLVSLDFQSNLLNLLLLAVKVFA
jgi:hypothetical protein